MKPGKVMVRPLATKPAAETCCRPLLPPVTASGRSGFASIRTVTLSPLASVIWEAMVRIQISS